jgi:hypothetical protein
LFLNPRKLCKGLLEIAVVQAIHDGQRTYAVFKVRATFVGC